MQELTANFSLHIRSISIINPIDTPTSPRNPGAPGRQTRVEGGPVRCYHPGPAPPPYPGTRIPAICLPRLLYPALLVTGMFFSPGQILAVSFFDQFIDPKDGKLDTSQWLAGRTGFLPIPIVVSDPAVGYGAGLALAFFHDSGNKARAGGDSNARLHLPPSISFVAGAQTDNGSWLAGAGHIASWKKDSIRYTGLLGYGDLNLEYYGVRPRLIPGNRSLSFDIQGTFLYQQLLFRIGDSDVFLGGRYSFLSADVGFNTAGPVPGVPRRQFESNTGGLGVVLRYDSRDNILSPDRGVFAKFEPMFFNEAFGGDYDYTKTKLSAISHWPVSDVVFGVRLEGEFANGDAPFYDVPYINMRGIPALRYQGDDVYVAVGSSRN